MQTLFQTFYRLVEHVSYTHQRYLYHIIDWDERLIGIKGARGVGKTTMVLQHIRHAFPDRKRSRCIQAPHTGKNAAAREKDNDHGEREMQFHECQTLE